MLTQPQTVHTYELTVDPELPWAHRLLAGWMIEEGDLSTTEEVDECLLVWFK